MALDSLTPAAVHSMLSSPKFLNWLLNIFIFLFQSSFHSLWTATLFSNDLLWLILLMEGVVLSKTVKSASIFLKNEAVSPYQSYKTVYLMMIFQLFWRAETAACHPILPKSANFQADKTRSFTEISSRLSHLTANKYEKTTWLSVNDGHVRVDLFTRECVCSSLSSPSQQLHHQAKLTNCVHNFFRDSLQKSLQDVTDSSSSTHQVARLSRVFTYQLSILFYSNRGLKCYFSRSRHIYSSESSHGSIFISN